MQNHTYAICAYKESAYLEECVKSVLAQNAKSRVIMCTSTPNAHIQAVCDKYGVPLHVNPAKSSIHGDWNFAMDTAGTEYVTLCHQDDVYEPGYHAALKAAVEKGGFDIFFTDYYELRNGAKSAEGTLLAIKRVLLWPLRVPFLQRARWAKRWALRFGNSICCPAVTYHRSALPIPLFKGGLKSNLDWETWVRISDEKGKFAYKPEKLMCHRIHEESETSRIIGENQRGNEDYQIFIKFWPPFIAKALTRFYAASEKSNDVK